MYRLFGCLVAFGVLALAPLAHAEKPEGVGQQKVLIAHLADTVTEEVVDEDTGEIVEVTTYYYNVISVAEPALANHLSHGDLQENDLFPDNETEFTGYGKGDKIAIEVSEPVVVE